MTGDHDGRDSLEQDMAAHERRFNGEVHAERNRVLAAEAMESAARERETAKAAPAPVLDTAPIAESVERKTINGHEYTISKAPDTTPMYRSATEFEANVLRHAEPRVKLLLSKQDEGPFGTPSWRTKALAAFYFKTKSIEAAHSGRPGEADAYDRAFQLDLHELLEASNQLFGDWRKDAPEKLIVSG